MINAISTADIVFTCIMSSSMSAWLLSPLECSPQKQNGWTLRFCFWGWIMWKMYNKTIIELGFRMISWIGPLQDPVSWYGKYYTGTQITQWDCQNKGTLTSSAQFSFVLKVPLRYLHPSIIYSVPCDRILQRAYYQNLVSVLSASAEHRPRFW